MAASKTSRARSSRPRTVSPHPMNRIRSAMSASLSSRPGPDARACPPHTLTAPEAGQRAERARVSAAAEAQRAWLARGPCGVRRDEPHGVPALAQPADPELQRPGARAHLDGLDDRPPRTLALHDDAYRGVLGEREPE